MAQIVLSSGRIDADNWRLLETPEALAEALQSGSSGARLLIPLALWLEQREALLAAPAALGVLLDGKDEPEPIAVDLDRLTLVAVRIPRFADGRAYSLARLLRGRYAYRGELRAVGDVLHDQLYYLSRVGFDAFALRADQDPAAARSALAAFSTAYQGSADGPALFRRRHAA